MLRARPLFVATMFSTTTRGRVLILMVSYLYNTVNEHS